MQKKTNKKMEVGQVHVKKIIENLFDTLDTDKLLYLEENEVACLLKFLYEDMGQKAPDKETVQGFMEAARPLGKFTKILLVDLLSPIFEEGLREDDGSRTIEYGSRRSDVSLIGSAGTLRND